MIKSGTKKYFTNLKFYFTPIGMLAVGMIIGVSLLIPATISAMKGFINEFSEILQTNNIDFGPTRDYIVNSITSLDWADPIASLKTMLGGEWLKTLVNGSMELLGIELNAYGEQIDQSFNNAVGIVMTYVGIFIFFSVIGLLLGFVLTRYLVRRNMAKRKLWKTILASVIDSLISSMLFALCVWLSTLWKPSVFISSLLSLVLYSSVSLLEAYLLHAVKKVPFKKVVSGKNVMMLMLTNFIIFYVSVAFLAISILVTNVIAGLFIGFAFVEIAFIVISLNAESYVIDIVGTDAPQSLQTASPAASEK